MIRQSFLFEPFFHQSRDVEVVLVCHEEMGVALDADFRQMDQRRIAAVALTGA